MHCVSVDITSAVALDKAFEDAGVVDAVIHIASFGMSGPAQLRRTLLQRINVGGTVNVVECCLNHGVGALVYVSSYNVVFNGCTIANGSEDALRVLDDHEHVDQYSRTKVREKGAGQPSAVPNYGLQVQSSVRMKRPACKLWQSPFEIVFVTDWWL